MHLINPYFDEDGYESRSNYTFHIPIQEERLLSTSMYVHKIRNDKSPLDAQYVSRSILFPAVARPAPVQRNPVGP